MIDDLKFVQGAVGRKEIVAGLTHFKIEKGTVRSYNGVIALSSPLALDFDCTPRATEMLKAIEACRDTVQITMASSGKLNIKSGAFSAFVPCLEEPTPHVEPEGTIVEIEAEGLIRILKLLYPFIGTDAYRPFSTGLRFRDQCAYATNNVVFIECWTGILFPTEAVIPRIAIQELLRIKEVPTHIQYTEKQMTFHYASGRWLTTSLLDVEWPDANPFFSGVQNCKPVDSSMFDAIDAILPFADDMRSCYIENGTMRTHYSTAEGASHSLVNLEIFGRYQMDMLAMLKGVAKTIDMTCYKAEELSPSVFYGDNLRGIITGLRL